MSGSGHRRTTKWDMEEGSRHYPGDPIGPGPERPSNRESQPRWHSRERNYKVAREPLDDTMAWDGDSRMSPGLDDWRQQKRKYSFESSRERSHRSRRRSKSPGHRLERPGLNDRVGRVASFDHRNHEPRRSGTMPCKFFASGNCRNGKVCRFSHSDQTRDSSNNHERDDYRQGVDSRVNMAPLREGSKWSGSSSDLNVPKRYGNRNEGLGEQRAMRNSVDGSSPRDNRFMAHRMDIDEATRNNRSDDYRLISQSSSGMGASESRGAAIHGVDIDGSANSVDGSAPRDNRFMAHRMDIDEATRNNRSDDFRLTTNNSSGMGASESRGPAIHGVDIDGSANSVDGSAPRDNRFMAHRMDITEATRNNRSDDFRLTTNSSSGMGASESRGTAIHGVDIGGSANSVDGGAPRDNKFMAHRIDIDEATTDNRSDDFRLTTNNSSGMGASESRGTAIKGVDIEGSATYTGDQLPTLIGTSRKPDVLDTEKSEETSSNQCLMSTEQFSDLTCSLARLLEDGKQLPELYAALNASNALGFMQSSAAVSSGPDVVPASSSRQYDPVNDSMELIKSVISEQPDKIALPSQLPLTGEPSGDGLYETHCNDVELNINSHLSSEKHQFADCENEEHGMVKAEETKEEQDGSKLSDNEGDDKADEKKKNIDGKSLRAFKFALAEFVKELLKPTWKAGQIDKEAHKTIVKKVVDKVTSSVQGVCIPQTQEKIDNYLTAYKPKLSKLVQAYVEKVQKENPKVA